MSVCRGVASQRRLSRFNAASPLTAIFHTVNRTAVLLLKINAGFVLRASRSCTRLWESMAQRPRPSDLGDGRIGTSTYGTGKLHRTEVERYSRQMMLPEVGSAGTRSLLDSHVLIVGAGGLGSTSSMYLAAAGIGKITIVDFDAVDRSNLHRQVVHTDDRVGVNKADSAAQTCAAINPTIQLLPVREQFTQANGVALVSSCDVVVDATDNVAARYLINDACVLAGKPLVSGSAMRWEGQLTVYNYNGGPCYRCVFPDPPPVATVGSCNDAGVIGALPGVIGCLQALEVQKVLIPTAAAEGGVMSGRMLFFDGLRGTYRMMRMRPRQPLCRSCGAPADHREKITSLASVGTSYEAGACVRVPNTLPPEHRVSAKEAAQRLLRTADGGPTCSEHDGTTAAVLVDVREAPQYDMCALPGSVSLPLSRLKAAADPIAELTVALATHADVGPTRCADVYLVCRRGNASVLAVQRLLAAMPGQSNSGVSGADNGLSGVWSLRNVDGGLNALVREAGLDFPDY
jgi:adenylyltransferase/sulfurtransferase